MSAYGPVLRQNIIQQPLKATTWQTSKSAANKWLIIFHLTLDVARKFDGLVDFLNKVFDEEVRDGRTYPQEGAITRPSFESYFFAADVFLGLTTDIATPVIEPDSANETDVSLANVQGDRTWGDCIGGFYYIKPNYPGRSSHICNGGFVVPPKQRGAAYGSALAQSFVHYAPKLGYEASVFNLVYVNNVASVKLWERLNFSKVGRIPRAGRLKKADGDGEEYVDAWVIYKSFKDDATPPHVF